MNGDSKSGVGGRRRRLVIIYAAGAALIILACGAILFSTGFLFVPTGSLSSKLATVPLYVATSGEITARRASDGTVLWRYTRGGAETAVADGIVFTTSRDEGLGTERSVYALRGSDGSLLWSHSTPGAVVAAGDGIVCLESFDRQNPSHMTALNARDGSVQWDVQLDGAYRPNATIVGNMVYVYGAGSAGTSSAGDYLYALQVNDGTVLWKAKTSFSDSPVPAVADGVVYVADLDGYVNAVRASNGALLWRVATGTNGARSTLATGPGAVYASSDNGYVVALNAVDGATLWQRTLEPSSSPSAANGAVYVNTYDGHLVALNAHDGTQLWSFSVHGLPDDFARPVVVGEGVFEGVGGGCFVLCSPNHVYGVRASDGAAAWGATTVFMPVVVA